MIESVRRELERDALRHLVQLKMLAAYPNATQVRVARAGAAAGTLVLLETRASPFDAAAYPDCGHLAIATASDPEAARELVDALPDLCPGAVIIKLSDAHVRGALRERYRAERVAAYVSLTAPAGLEVALPESVERGGLTPDLLPFFLENDYTRAELTRLFAQGAESFTVREAARPVASCFVFHCCADVFEIAGLYTQKRERRRGHARRVVAAAVAHVLGRGGRVRYQVHESNAASIALARSLGLEPFLTVEHWRAVAEVSP